ncbi:MAG: hypothetical protein Kow00122_20430 [Thermoleophilia bacterium]
MLRSRPLNAVVAAVAFVVLILMAWQYLQQASAGDGGPERSRVEAAGEAAAAGQPAGDSVPTDGGEAGQGDASYGAFDQTGGTVSVNATVVTEGSAAGDAQLGEVAGLLAREEFAILLLLDTHSVDLSGFDPVAAGSLSTPSGRLAPTRWIALSDSSHHRSGALVFPRDFDPSSAEGELSLTLAGLAGVPERVLSWNLPLP